MRQPFSETNLVLLMALLSADRAFVIFNHQKCENLSEHKGSWRLQKEWTSMGFQKIGVNRSNNIGKKKLGILHSTFQILLATLSERLQMCSHYKLPLEIEAGLGEKEQNDA